MTEPASLPTAGQLVGGKYRIERLLGKGGMGAVFAAYHEILQQRVALKVMLSGPGAQAHSVARFINEARNASRIEGEHVARVLDVGQLPDGSPFIALEFLEGSDLAAVLAERGPLPAEEVVGYVIQALRGARAGARPRHRPPRSQAGEPVPREAPRRQPARQGARLRHREDDRSHRRPARAHVDVFAPRVADVHGA